MLRFEGEMTLFLVTVCFTASREELNLVTLKAKWNKFIPVMSSTLQLWNRDRTLLRAGTNRAGPRQSRSAVASSGPALLGGH